VSDQIRATHPKYLAALLFDNPSLEHLYQGLFAFYIAILVLLPTGSVFGVNVKILTAVLVSVSTSAYYLHRQRPGFVRATFTFVPPFILLLWVLLGAIYGFNPVLGLTQYKDFVATFAGCWFISVFVKSSDTRRLYFVKLVIYSVAAVAALKLTMLVYAFSKGIPVIDIVLRISDFFGAGLITVDIGDAGGRIQFVSDILIPVCVFALLSLRRELKINVWLALVLQCLFISSAILGFSRFIWAYTALCLLLGVVVGRKDRLTLLLLIVLLVPVGYSAGTLRSIVELRFSSQFVDSSDVERVAQRQVLLVFFEDSPILGHGLGSHPSQIIRSEALPYSYEFQLLALLGQVGIVGFSALGVLLFLYFRQYFATIRDDGHFKAAVFCLLFAWVSSGVFNPFLVSSCASVGYGSIMALGTVNRTMRENVG